MPTTFRSALTKRKTYVSTAKHIALLVRRTLRYIAVAQSSGPHSPGDGLMAQSKSPTTSESTKSRPTREANTVSPAVIVDFVFDGGLFFISVNNISDRPAYKVSIKFDHKLMGLGGAKEISALPLFRNIEFLAPGKAIRTFLDSSDSYFARKQPTRITAQVSYRDAEGDKHKVSIFHDLEIYRELPFIGKSDDVRKITDEVTDEGE